MRHSVVTPGDGLAPLTAPAIVVGGHLAGCATAGVPYASGVPKTRVDPSTQSPDGAASASSMPRILVLDANQRSTLAVVRSLGSRQLRVITAAHTEPTLAGSSNCSAAFVRYADPAMEPARFLDDVSRIVRRLDIDLVIPTTDLTTMILVANSGCTGSALLAAPSSSSYERLTDKSELLRLCEQLGVATPATHVARCAAEATRISRDLGYPLVLKPARSRYRRGNQIISTSVSVIRSAEQLRLYLSNAHWLGDIPCLVQRFVPGYGAGMFALYDRDRPLAWFSHRRLREIPPSGGASVLSESTPIEPRMQAAASSLMSAVEWSGVAMLEFRVSEDGTPFLIEVNGRFWGSLQLAVDCGVDFPWLLYQLTTGIAPMSPPGTYLLGRRLRWLLGDFENLRIQARRESANGRTRASIVWEFLRSFGDCACKQEVFRWNDPKPGIREIQSWAGAILRRKVWRRLPPLVGSGYR